MPYCCRVLSLLAVLAAVDRQMRTASSGGVELLDLHDSVAPRRQRTQRPPTLESFRFIPYDEQSLATSLLGNSDG